MSRYYIGCYSAKKATAKIVTYYSTGDVSDVNYYKDSKKCWEDYKDYSKYCNKVEYYERNGSIWIRYDVSPGYIEMVK